MALPCPYVTTPVGVSELGNATTWTAMPLKLRPMSRLMSPRAYCQLTETATGEEVATGQSMCSPFHTRYWPLVCRKWAATGRYSVAS